MTTTSTRDRLLSDATEKFAGVRPSFALDQQADGVTWITDRGRRIALVHRPFTLIDMFEFDPLTTRVRNPVLPVRYHAPTQLGVRVTAVQWVDWTQGCTSVVEQFDVRMEGQTAVLDVRERWPDRGMTSHKRFTFRVDAKFGYVLDQSNKIVSDTPAKIEFCNLLAAGQTHWQQGLAKFPWVVWKHPQRGLLKWASNNLSSRCLGQLDAKDRRRIDPDGGWIGLLGEPDLNPMLQIQRASQPVASITCHNLLDEHVHFKGDPARTADGRYEWQLDATLLSCPPAIAAELIEEAEQNDLEVDTAHPQRTGPGWQSYVLIDPNKPRRYHVFPIVPGEVCDFSREVPMDQYFRGAFWPIQEDVPGWATTTRQRAHSGERCMMLTPDAMEQTLGFTGSSMWLPGGRRYRASAYAGAAGAGGAWLRMSVSQFYFNGNAAEDRYEAFTRFEGDADWRKLSFEFTTLADTPAFLLTFTTAGITHDVRRPMRVFVDDIFIEPLG